MMDYVFLFCTERSGSNLITSMAGGHPEISGPPPSHLFRLFGLNGHNYAPASNSANWDAFVEDFMAGAAHMVGDWDSRISEEGLRAACPNRSIAEALDYLYETERKAGETVSFVKENHSYLIAPFLLANWPHSRFVYQVRDPRDVVASWIGTPLANGGVVEAVATWRTDQIEILKVVRQIELNRPVARIRYEDLISDPETTMRKMCETLGIVYSAAMLEFYVGERVRRNAGKTSAWQNLAKPVLSDNSGKYRSRLTKSDIRYIELSCAELMQIFDYHIETDAASVPADEAASECKRLEPELSPGVPPGVQPEADKAKRTGRKALIERVISRKSAA